jgi:FemAB-related protein (PEP-CTERM system-associated)
MTEKSNNLSISELKDGDEQEWDAYVCSATDTGFLHLAGWKRVLAKTYDHELSYLMVKEGDKIQGILPLFTTRNRFFGTHISSTPGGISAKNEQAGHMLLEAAINIAEDVDADDLLLTGGTRIWDGDFVTIQRHCTQRLSLPSEPDQLWKSISRHKRKNVNKAERNGLSVTMGGEEHIDYFYEVFSLSLRSLGTPVFDINLIHNIMAEFPEQTRILVAKKGKQPIGALLLFFVKEVVYAQWAASSREALQYRPNDYLYWEMLRWACKQGFRHCDMGRSQWNTGNYKFKALWGAETYPLYYQYYLRRGANIPDFNIKVERSPLYRLVNRTWQILPVPVTQMVGPYLRKYLYPL